MRGGRGTDEVVGRGYGGMERAEQGCVEWPRGAGSREKLSRMPDSQYRKEKRVCLFL
jgi:hypothetical protein